jgi:glycosidase
MDFDTWFRAGGGWKGGTIKGLRSKLGYLRRPGITALWISPVFRQVAFAPTSPPFDLKPWQPSAAWGGPNED